jgi:DNA-binding transcriptional MerR regulator
MLETRSPLTIGMLAKATGTKAETIRYYERIRLLRAPRRTPGNYRSYDGTHVRWLKFVRRSRSLGFSIDEVRALLRLADMRNRDCGEVDRIASEHLAAVCRKITDLRRLGAELRRMILQCRGGVIAHCRIIEALSQEDASLRKSVKR